jgi:hypothetical protein
VNHGVDTAMDLIDTRQCLHHLAIVSEIGADEVGPGVRRGDAVEG